MDAGNFDRQAEKYKEELMKLYSRSNPSAAETKENSEATGSSGSKIVSEEGKNYDPVSEEISEVNENAPDDTAWSPHSEEDREASEDIEDEFNTRYPEPDLSELDTELGTASQENIIPPEYFSLESMGDEKGYILVNVRTGSSSYGIEGAMVMVTAVVDGRRVVMASGLTDRSGVSPKFELPVPGEVHSQEPGSDIRPYNLFDVSVTAEGFFNARSVDVPVFPGITSVQNFNLIPVPLMMNPSDETLTYYNEEPNFGFGKE